MKVESLERCFRLSGMELPDPSPGSSLQTVKELFARTYPEALNAQIKGPTLEGIKEVYQLLPIAETKG